MPASDFEAVVEADEDDVDDPALAASLARFCELLIRVTVP